MKITHLGHSAVLVEANDVGILIDPGNLSDAWVGLRDLDAVLITHLHPDHVDVDRVGALLEANPKAEVWAEPQACEVLDIPRANPLVPGHVTMVGPLRVRAVGGTHACIHPDIETIGNVGYLIRELGAGYFFHPGDSLEAIPDRGIDVVAVPAYGPWAAMKETIDFVRAVGAPRGFLMHEGLLNDRGYQLVFDRVNDMTDTRLTDLRAGDSLSL